MFVKLFTFKEFKYMNLLKRPKSVKHKSICFKLKVIIVITSDIKTVTGLHLNIFFIYIGLHF